MTKPGFIEVSLDRLLELEDMAFEYQDMLEDRVPSEANWGRLPWFSWGMYDIDKQPQRQNAFLDWVCAAEDTDE